MENVKINFDRLERFFMRISQLSLLFMMILTSVDALSRYFLKSSITGAYELTESYLMIIMVFLGISYVYKINGHISLDIFSRNFSKIMRVISNLLISLTTTVYFFFIGLEGLKMTINAFENNLVMSGLINFPLWFSYIWIPTGSFLIVVRLIIQTIYGVSNR